MLSPEPRTILWQIASDYWPVPVAAFACSLIGTPICRAIALKRGIVDRPDTWLKPHARPTPYLGGVAVFLGWAVGIGAAMFRVPELAPSTVGGLAIATSLLAGLIIMLTGLYDDLRVMKPAVKLTCCLIVAGIVIAGGIGDDLIRMITKLMSLDLERPLVIAFSLPISVFIIVGACNATNLIDGLDGLCSGVLGIISVGFLALAVHLAMYGDAEPEEPVRIALALAMLGAALGFLPYNRNPARVFLGDAGSMLLGLNAAILILLFGKAGIVRWMIGALMVFGLPIYDMLLTLARRWRNNRPLMKGDRSHFYDQLIDRGYSVRQVVGISYGLTLFFVGMGCATMFVRTRYAILVYMVVTVLVAVTVWKMDMVCVDAPPAQGGSRNSGEADA